MGIQSQMGTRIKPAITHLKHLLLKQSDGNKNNSTQLSPSKSTGRQRFKAGPDSGAASKIQTEAYNSKTY